jgi:hypothetical protein
VWVNACFFVGIGFGLRHSWLGGAWGFDPDDAFCLMAPLAWLGWLAAILLAAGIVTPVVAGVLGIRLLRRRCMPPCAIGR